jgi:diguanylate cyclase (GGDEF)-like protein
MRLGRRTELLVGLVLPLLVLAGLVVVALNAQQPAVPIAFMTTVPMFSAMVSRPLVAEIVALATVLAAGVTAASAYGQDFADALPVLIGVIVGAGIAVIASQAEPVAAPRRSQTPANGPAPHPSAGEPASQPGHPSPAQPDVDDLTGLPTRTFVERSLRVPGESAPRVVMVVGCDGITRVNAERGQDIGDVFLFAVAGRTRYALPDQDVVARWDGDQVLAVIHGDPVAVRPTLELIADKVNHNPIRTGSGLVPLTICVGAAVWPEGGTFEGALARARRALHAAKAQGPAHLVFDAEADHPTS